MSRCFNIEGACNPLEHYMVNLDSRVEEIKELVDKGKYFTINKARQFGKTTILGALSKYLIKSYIVIDLDFQLFSHADFETEPVFVSAFSRELLANVVCVENMPETIQEKLLVLSEAKEQNARLAHLFSCLSEWCAKAEKPLVLMIDEVDSATNNQVFLDFLSQLRGYYIHRRKRPTFQSVILAGVYDIKNLKQKISSDSNDKTNSPWNIAAEFKVNMNFEVEDIAGMLSQYEGDYRVGMDIEEMSGLFYDYTSGYPFLVSCICKKLEECVAGSPDFPDRTSAWTKEGFLAAVKIILAEPNTLFESLIHKLEDYPELEEMLRDLLFKGKEIAYVVGIRSIEVALMFGFVKKDNNMVVVSNRIFETVLYNLFLATPAMQQKDIYDVALQEKNQFIQDGHLNMELILNRFVMHFGELYGECSERFVEEDGRRLFLLYLRTIINGVGNYYIESQTRNRRRTDVIVDYRGEQFVIEMKVWRGNEYHTRGENQLKDYLDYYHLQKGYMLSFNFNKSKQVGVKHVNFGDKILIEAVV